LRDAKAEQVQAHVTRSLEADNKLVTNSVVTHFQPADPHQRLGNTVYGLWNADNMVPPPIWETLSMARTPTI
jgi:hypothetical protein